MGDGCWGVSTADIGHQRSSNVITQGHVAKKGDLIINFDQVCVLYRWKGYLSGSRLKMLGCRQWWYRLAKVIQGHCPR